MNVLVTGGDGFVGSYLCDELASRGHNVTALSRDPDPSVFTEDVETAMGDLTAYESIESAFEGVDVVLNLVALSPLFQPKGGDEKHFEIHLGGTENAVRAAEEHSVPKIVQMSALGADPWGQTAYIRSKGQAEDVVQDSELDWVIFRPSVVFGEGGEFVSFTEQLTPPFLAPLPGGGRTRFQPIWVEDLAAMLADAVENDDYDGEAYEIGGPEVLTLADVARMIQRAEGKSVSIVPVPMSLAEIGMSIADPIPMVPFGSDQARSLQMDNTVSENDVGAFDMSEGDLKTLGEYLDVR
ncbi:complex I NDUFA9 subunit family protein [Halobacteriales archaeon QS_3_64_16]|nr:MAG: complex I NDUFA9 subunit family protein [Halobacteriales archaeon QS_3_64_16]